MPARWRRLASSLGAESLVKAALKSLYLGQPWSDPVRAACPAWMRDGRWVDFWGAYVAMLSPAKRARWRRALARPGDPAQRAWRLVSAGLLLAKD